MSIFECRYTPFLAWYYRSEFIVQISAYYEIWLYIFVSFRRIVDASAAEAAHIAMRAHDLVAG